MTSGGAHRVRRGRPNARYTAIANELIDHPTLSPEARLVLIYLLSKPQDWELQPGDLRRLLGKGDTRCGRNKTYEVIKELKDEGYVQAITDTDELGHFEGVTYYVYDEPIKARARTPATGQPVMAEEANQTLQARAPRPGIRDAARAPRPDFRDPEKGDLRKERTRQKTELPPPSPAIANAAKAGSEAFDQLWSCWPHEARPRERQVACHLFGRLTSSEQELALRYAAEHCNIQRRRGEGLKMISYLRDRLFSELASGPARTVDGYFKVTPDRPEWAPWLLSLRARFSLDRCEELERLGYLLVRTRWPVEPPLLSSNRNHAPSFARGYG